ncbi:hypothetical protein D3C86_2102570 [compost metagenome]
MLASLLVFVPVKPRQKRTRGVGAACEQVQLARVVHLKVEPVVVGGVDVGHQLFEIGVLAQELVVQAMAG